MGVRYSEDAAAILGKPTDKFKLLIDKLMVIENQETT
jgi:hypothetical protein